MTKPILVIRLAFHTTMQELDRIKDGINDKIHDDYHVMFVTTERMGEINFECHNVQDVDETSFEKFKAEIEAKIKKIQK